MGKIAEKKKAKKTTLMDSAYELFASKGFSDTTIHDIAHRAGVAKGTFYLYFRDKEALRDELIRRHTARLLREACDSLTDFIQHNCFTIDIADQFIYIIDYIVDHVVKDKALIRLIAKNLTWGLFHMHYNDVESVFFKDQDREMDFETYISEMLRNDGIKLKDPQLLMFTLLSLVSSTCYDLLMYGEPVPLAEYKSYLNHCIKLLVNDALI